MTPVQQQFETSQSAGSNASTTAIPRMPENACTPSCQADFATLPLQSHAVPTSDSQENKTEYVFTVDAKWPIPRHIHVIITRVRGLGYRRFGVWREAPPTYYRHVLFSDSPAKGALGVPCQWYYDACTVTISQHRVTVHGAFDPKAFSIVVQPIPP